MNLCENLNEIGVTMNGGMAEYVAIPARNIHLIPDNLSFEVATFADPLACSIRGLDLDAGSKLINKIRDIEGITATETLIATSV